MEIRIIIADDYPANRRILCDMLESHPTMKVIGEAGNGKDAIECCLNQKPDIALIDVNMPDMKGIEAAHQIVSQLPQVKVLAISGNSDLRYVRAMLKAGATGYIHKDSLSKELINAVRTIARGAMFYCHLTGF
jgi:DNA-binding NarL/FixJ family response regulator